MGTDTKLGLAQRNAKATQQGRFAVAVAGARPFVPWRIPRLDVDAVVTLLPHNRAEEIDGAVQARMAQLSLLENRNRVEGARAVRYAAEAVLDPDTKLPIGTLDEWSRCDEDVIGEFWRVYDDVRKAYDPLELPLADDEIAGIEEALKKNSYMLLRFYGGKRLATYLLSMADRLLNSPSPSAGATSSQPETSSPESSPTSVEAPARPDV